MRRKLLVLGLLFTAGLAATGAAAAGNGGFGPVPPNSESASDIATVYWVILGIAGAVFLVVTIPLLVFVVRYRSAGRDRSVDGPQIRGNTNLELGWTAGAALILVAIAALVFIKLPGLTSPSAGAAPELRITVDGRQFYWQYRYPNGVISINRLRVPAERLVRLEVSAPEWDVNHSFWAPALNGKIDAIPGVTNHLEFKAERPGVFQGQCAEFCGLQHAAMTLSVEVMTQDAFDQWLSEQEGASPTALGQEEWEGICATCHRIGDEPQLVGPSLTASTLANEQTIETIVQSGRGLMPPVGRGWSDEQLSALVAYTTELSKQVGGG